MRILFVGAYNDSEIALAPIKVGRELFKNISNECKDSLYLCYFDDGSKYTRTQKLFGFIKIHEKVYRCGIFPFLYFVIKIKPDIIQITTPDAFYLLAFLIKMVMRFKMAYLTHSIISYYLKNFLEINYYQKLRLYLIEKIVYKYSDLLQMLSETEMRYVTRYLKVESSKCRIVSNGINLSGYRRAYTGSTELIKIMCVGSIERKEKSFDILFGALSTINHPVLITIYGYEYEKSEDIRLPDNIKLILGNPLNEIELRKEFCNNDLFIIASRYETFSLSLLEAMETGILFISTDRVGLTSRFPESFKRFLIPSENSEKLRNKIMELHLLDNTEKNKLSNEIRKFAEGFVWDKVSDEYIKLYNELSEKN